MASHPITRRSAAQGFVVAVVGGAAGFLVARSSSAANKKSATTAANGYGTAPSAGGRLLAKASQVPAGGGLILGDAKVVLTGASDGTIHAFSAVCTHQGCTVDSVSGGAISCPCHGSSFDAQTGSVISGPASSPLPKVAIVTRDGNVYGS